MEFDFQLDDKEKLRHAFRTHVPGLDVRVVTHDGPREFPVRDISATGFAFTAPARDFSMGMLLSLDLLLSKRLLLGDLKAKVVHVREEGAVGCSFQEMQRRQEIKLDKLVLEVQKRLIELRKAKREAE
jgi:hypothetical protein